jgi:DNA-binding XRE family transcriptional regulator
MKIGDKLQMAREQAGLSQSELARAAGVKLGTLKSVEQGWRLPSWPTLHRLARTLKFDLGSLSGLEIQDHAPVKNPAQRKTRR